MIASKEIKTNQEYIMPSLSYPSSSTTVTVKDILYTATLAASTPLAVEVANDIQKEPNWRWQYHHHAVRHVQVCAESSSEQCLEVAKAGLEQIYSTFRYGEDDTLAEALRKRRENPKSNPSDFYFTTGRLNSKNNYSNMDEKRTYKTENASPMSRRTLPIGGKILRGDEVDKKLLHWATKGVIEPDTAAAVCNMKESDLDLTNSDWVFVILGAGAAMGPLDTLLSLGATVIALDLPIPAIWEKLFAKAKSSKGSIIFPMIRKDNGNDKGNNNDNDIHLNEKEMASRAGCNFLTHIPELIDWLVLQCHSKRLVIGQYAYLDSAAFVKVSLAMDAVASECLRQRPDSALAYLCSPTDVFAIPPAARDASARQYKEDMNNKEFQNRILQLLSGNHMLQQNIVPGTRATAGNHPKIPIVDALVLQQGPNYFFAKRLQHWRAMLVHYGQGGIVSSNVAPASYTTSVLKNRLLAAAFAGAEYIAPVEIFDPETSNVLMTYLLLHDLKQQRRQRRANSSNSSSLLNEAERRPDLADHPLSLFATTPVHNGIWRCGFQIRSLLELVLIYYFLDQYRPHLLTTTAAAAALGVGATLLRRSRL